LTLPRELVERILLLLDTKSMLKCRLVNREFDAIIQSSTLVQYYLACKAAGVIDNPQSPLSYAERLEALKKREDAWKKLKPVFETTIKVNYESSVLYELTAGNYFRRDKNGKNLYYCHLPSSPQDNPQWFRIPGHGPGQSWSGSIIEMGMAIYEHDLVVNVISSEVGNQTDMRRHSLDLVLLKLSTGEYHPLAHHSIIHIQRSSPRPDTTVSIVGDNLALVVNDEDGSKLFIFDWKSGHKRLQHKATANAYKNSGPIFVSPDLLLVPNCILSHLEVWYLFPSHPNPNPPVQILSLQIPAVSANYWISSIYCHGEPRAFLHSNFPPRPFFSSSENSIIIINFRLMFFPRKYKLIMHRRALLDMIQKWTSPSLLEQQEDWGPPISRWWQVSELQQQLTATSAGQRYAFAVPNPCDESKCMICVADFNPYNVRRNAEMMAQLRGGEGQDNDGNGNNGEGKKDENDENLEILDHEGVFSEEVCMGLKCVVYHAPGEYDFDAVFMDEERLVGLKVSTRK
ncbi:hypothetical protein M378DRAFT_84575, partial [Amanita muscaria Koide BX008]